MCYTHKLTATDKWHEGYQRGWGGGGGRRMKRVRGSDTW